MNETAALVERACIAHGGARGIHFNGDCGCKWVRRFRLRVGGFPAHTATGWGWGYEVLDMARPEGCRIAISGLRPRWSQALMDGAAALRYLAGYRSCGWE